MRTKLISALSALALVVAPSIILATPASAAPLSTSYSAPVTSGYTKDNLIGDGNTYVRDPQTGSKVRSSTGMKTRFLGGRTRVVTPATPSVPAVTKELPVIGKGKISTIAKNAGWASLLAVGPAIGSYGVEGYCAETAAGSSSYDNGFIKFTCGDLYGYADLDGVDITANGLGGDFIFVPQGTNIGGAGNPCKVYIQKTGYFVLYPENAIPIVQEGGICESISSQFSGSKFQLETSLSYSNPNADGFMTKGLLTWLWKDPLNWVTQPGSDDFGFKGFCTNKEGRTSVISGSQGIGPSGLQQNAEFQCPSGTTFEGAVTYVPAWIADQSGSSAVYTIGTQGFELPEEGTTPGTMRVTLRCSNGNETKDEVTNVKTSVTPGTPWEIPEVTCPAGWISLGAGVTWIPDVGSPVEIVPINNEQVTPSQKELVLERPDCFNGTIKCELTLDRKLSGSETDLETCGSVGQYCVDWAEDPYAPDHYLCRFGGVKVDLNMCSAYRFPETGVVPNVDKEGNKVPYSDKTNPVTEPTATDDGAESSKNCRAPSFIEGLSPYWIWKGAVCAIQDAFVPNPTKTKLAVQEMTMDWKSTAPGRIANFVTTMNDDLPTLDGCSGPRVKFDIDLTKMNEKFFFPVDFYPLSACEAPFKNLAAISKLFTGVSIAFFATMAITRYIGGIVGFGGFGKSSGD